MEYTDVKSSSVKSVAYDDDNSVLGVRFKNGSEYHYFKVPQRVYTGLLTADSVGRYLDKYVKKAKYRYKKVK